MNQFRREHTLDELGGARDYSNYGTKGEANAFAKFSYDAAPLASLRRHAAAHHRLPLPRRRGRRSDPLDVLQSEARRALRPVAGDRASTPRPASRRASRRATISSRARTTPRSRTTCTRSRPSALVDLEAGWDRRTRAADVKANVYAMEFHNEIASTGELSDIGLLLRRNVDRSYRRGIELEGAWQATPSLRLRGNANLSRNRISKWTQFYDVDDIVASLSPRRESCPHAHAAREPVDRIHADSRPLTLGVDRPLRRQVVSRQHERRPFITPSFSRSRRTPRTRSRTTLRVRLQVNNVLNNKRIWPSGYSYLFLTPQKTVDGISYYYPQATRNAVVMVEYTR